MFNRNTAILLLPLAVLIFSSCMAVPFATSYRIDKKLEDLSLGASREEVTRKLGTPIFLIDIPHEKNKVEVLGYDMGNYWYHEAKLFVFKNDVLMGMPENTYELLKFLTSMHVFEGLRFFDVQDKQE